MDAETYLAVQSTVLFIKLYAIT